MLSGKLLCVLGLLILAISAQSPGEADRVKGLIIPFYTKPWYSGYLNISYNKAFHYIFFPSQHDPDNDPLLLWLNGGPGCSSLIGLSYENGPWKFDANKTSFRTNPYSWNNKANLLYIESPGSVGFSIGPVKSSDESVQADNLAAMIEFFAKFPSYRNNDLYLSGQSYAGIYVPWLALAIHNYNNLPSTHLPMKLKGFIVGNACTDPEECYVPGADGTSLFQYQFLYKHSFYTEREYDDMRASCVLGFGSHECYDKRSILDAKFDNTSTSILNIYSICYNQPNPPEGGRRLSQSGKRAPQGDLDCDDSRGAYHFFNDPMIRLKLNLGDFDPDYKWTLCSDAVGAAYQSNPNASLWIYPILMKAGYRIWVYSGDVDADVPVTGTRVWLQRLRDMYSVPIMEPWREWWVPGRHIYEDQVGGMVWKLQNLTFASVLYAGHMVPKDQPAAAYVLIDSFLSGKDLPEA